MCVCVCVFVCVCERERAQVKQLIEQVLAEEASSSSSSTTRNQEDNTADDVSDYAHGLRNTTARKIIAARINAQVTSLPSARINAPSL